MSGPLNAGGFPGRAAGRYVRARAALRQGAAAGERPPAENPQFFGEVDIDGDSGELTVRLRQDDGQVLFRKVLQPGRVGRTRRLGATSPDG
ncbi:Alkaline phosphatase OS=Streptomyces rimosus subsp. rimosus (strain ATCC / DSM 40260 / JCM 4667/ NRRL 2234) OX=1265868 GN=SRIM_003880 PE=4 SV=1 [Streptomyces rimosus subsp. rimosus]